MKQLTHEFKSGKRQVLKVSGADLKQGIVLVRTFLLA